MTNYDQIFCAIVVFFFYYLASAQATTTNFNKLPKTLLPKHYKLEVITFFEELNFTFIGKVWIVVYCVESSLNITLHSLNLKIDEKEVTVMDFRTKERFAIRNHFYDRDNEFYTIQLGRPMSLGGEYLIYIPYNGTLASSMRGYYKTSFSEPQQGKRRYV